MASGKITVAEVKAATGMTSGVGQMSQAERAAAIAAVSSPPAPKSVSQAANIASAIAKAEVYSSNPSPSTAEIKTAGQTAFNAIKDQYNTLKNTQQLEIKALKQEVGSSAASAEKVANKAELSSFLSGMLSNPGQNTLTSASTYNSTSGNGLLAFQRVSDAYGLQQQYNLAPGKVSGNTTTGIPLTRVDTYLQSDGQKGGFVKKVLDFNGLLAQAVADGALTQQDILDAAKGAGIKKSEDQLIKQLQTKGYVRFGDTSGQNLNYATTSFMKDPITGSYSVAGTDKYRYDAPSQGGIGALGGLIGAGLAWWNPLGWSAMASGALGGAVGGGLSSGDLKGAITGGLLGGLGGYIKDTGIFNDLVNKVGFTPAQAENVLTSGQVMDQATQEAIKAAGIDLGEIARTQAAIAEAGGYNFGLPDYTGQGGLIFPPNAGPQLPIDTQVGAPVGTSIPRPVGMQSMLTQLGEALTSGDMSSAGTIAGSIAAAGGTALLPSFLGGSGSSDSAWNSAFQQAASGGGVNWGNILGAGASMLGGYLSGESAVDAARIAAEAQLKAAEMSRFKPVGVTSRFGASNFQYDNQGNLIGAGYIVAPDIAAQRERLLSTSGGLLDQFTGAKTATAPMATTAQRAMELGQGYLAKTPQEQAAKYYAEQMALLEPGNQAELAKLRNDMFNQGRVGLAVGGYDGLMATNPELAAYQNKLEMQKRQLAAQATQGGMDYAKFGTMISGAGGDLLKTMYGTQQAAYAPYDTAMKGAAYLEGLGQQPFDMGVNLGAKGASANQGAATLMSQAAQTMQPANAWSPWGTALGNLGNSIQNYQTQQQQQQYQQQMQQMQQQNAYLSGLLGRGTL